LKKASNPQPPSSEGGYDEKVQVGSVIHCFDLVVGLINKKLLKMALTERI